MADSFFIFYHSQKGGFGLVAGAKRMHGTDGITTYNSPSGNVDDKRDGREFFVTLKDISLAGFWSYNGGLGKLSSEFTSMVLYL